MLTGVPADGRAAGLSRRARRRLTTVTAAAIVLLSGCSSSGAAFTHASSSPANVSAVASGKPDRSSAGSSGARATASAPRAAEGSTGRIFPAAAGSLLPACKQALADYVARLPATAHLYPVIEDNFPHSTYFPTGPQGGSSISCEFGVAAVKSPGPTTPTDGILLGLSVNGPQDAQITQGLQSSSQARPVRTSTGIQFALETNPLCDAGGCLNASDCPGATACMGHESGGEGANNFYVGIAHLSDAAPDRVAAMRGVDYGKVLLDWVNSLSFTGDLTGYGK